MCSEHRGPQIIWRFIYDPYHKINCTGKLNTLYANVCNVISISLTSPLRERNSIVTFLSSQFSNFAITTLASGIPHTLSLSLSHTNTHTHTHTEFNVSTYKLGYSSGFIQPNFIQVFIQVDILYGILFLLLPTNAQLFITISYLYNVHSYMFRHFCVIFREFQKLLIIKN